MSADSLSTLLLFGSFVSAAMVLLLLVSRQSLGAASEGTLAWIGGDVAHAVGRALLVGSLTPDFVVWWERHLGTWHGHQFAASLHAVALWLQFVALRQLVGRRAWPPVPTVLAGVGVFVACALVFGCIGSVALRKAAAFGIVATGASALMVAVWPLARRSWGARLLLMVCGAAVVRLVVGLLEARFSAQGLASLGQSPQRPDFVAELVASLSATMAFVLVQQERLRERIAALGVTDALTGACNRAGLLPMLQRELRAGQRSGRPLSVVLFDLDHFKRVNDSHGHGAGDTVLREVAALIRRDIRPRDVLCRWGGEEFLLMLPEQRGDAATLTACRIAQALRQAPVDVGGGARLKVTLSAGVAALEDGARGDGSATAGIDALVAAADRRLYQAKLRRDCVVSHRGAYAPAASAGAAAPARRPQVARLPADDPA